MVTTTTLSLLLLAMVLLFAQSTTALCFALPSRYGGPARSVSVMGGGPVRGDFVPQLLELIAPTQRGLIVENNVAIIETIDRIEQQKFPVPLASCEGKWELMFTTEKETLFFAKNGLFGKKVVEISQTIDLRANLINNLIAFQGDCQFSVDGTVDPDATIKNQLNFKFTRAQLVLPPLINFGFPPVGSGWFRNVYVNKNYRVAKDVRGDYLVLRRQP